MPPPKSLAIGNIGHDWLVRPECFFILDTTFDVSCREPLFVRVEKRNRAIRSVSCSVREPRNGLST